jgi:uncharacterized membrane protein
MRKEEFLKALKKKLSGLPKQEAEERIGFYAEMIDDRMEEGLSEEDAVAQIGSVDAIASQIIEDIPLTAIARERIKTKPRLEIWEIVLLVLGSPIWLSIAISLFAVVASVGGALLLSLLISVWAVFASLAGVAVGGVFFVIITLIQGAPLQALAMLGITLVCAGLSMLMFQGSIAASKGIVWLWKKMFLGMKKLLVKKERI